MKLALVHPSLGVRGGAERVVMWLAGEMARRGHTVTVFTGSYDQGLHGPRPPSFEIVTLGDELAQPVHWERAAREVSGLVAGYDVVNPHNFPAYIWVHLSRRFARKLPPVVWYCEEPLRWLYRGRIDPHCTEETLASPISARLPQPAIERKSRKSYFRRARLRLDRELERRRLKAVDYKAVHALDQVLTNSGFVAGNVDTIFRRQAQICYPGIPVDGPARGVEGDYLLTVSRLFPEKNLFRAIEAFALLTGNGAHADVRYMIVGAGPLQAELERYVHHLGLQHRVRFVGAVDDEALSRFYAGARAVLYVPLDETFGLVFLEAALHGKAVVAPNHGGPTEVVVHGVTGLCADPLKPRDIASCLARIFEDKHLSTTMGEQGRQRLISEFTLEKFGGRFESAVRRLV